MTKSDPNHNDHVCPACDDWIAVPIPYAKNITCPWCNAKLEIHPDAEFDRGMWHDRTELSIVDAITV